MFEVYSDGGARGNPGPAAYGFVIYKDSQELVRYSKYLGRTTNNVAEYWGVIAALKWLSRYQRQKSVYAGGPVVKFFLDSELVVQQLQGNYKIKSQRLLPLAQQVKELEKKLETKITYQHVPRTKNKIADSLVNAALDASTS